MAIISMGMIDYKTFRWFLQVSGCEEASTEPSTNTTTILYSMKRCGRRAMPSIYSPSPLTGTQHQRDKNIGWK